MAKRWKKQKSGSQKSKRRKKRQGDGSGKASGTMSSLRGGLKGFFGTGGKPKKPGQKSPFSRVIDILLWVAVAVAAYIFISKRCAS